MVLRIISTGTAGTSWTRPPARPHCFPSRPAKTWRSSRWSPNSGRPALVDGRRLFDALYSTVNIAGGSGDGNPVTVLAMLIAMIGTITYLLLTAVVVLAGLAGIAITAPDKPDLPRVR